MVKEAPVAITRAPQWKSRRRGKEQEEDEESGPITY